MALWWRSAANIPVSQHSANLRKVRIALHARKGAPAPVNFWLPAPIHNRPPDAIGIGLEAASVTALPSDKFDD